LDDGSVAKASRTALNRIGADARDRASLLLAALRQNAGDIISIPNPALDRIARRHLIPTIIEQLAQKQGVGGLATQLAAAAVLAEPGLNLIEQGLIDDRLMLSGVASVTVVDLAAIHPIAQEMD